MDTDGRAQEATSGADVAGPSDEESAMAAHYRRLDTVIAGLAGVLWVVLALGRAPLTGVLDQPSWTEDPSSIVDFYTNSSFDAAFMAGIALATVAYVLFLVFIAKTAYVLGHSAVGSGWLGYLILGGAALDVSLVYAYLAPFAAAVFWAGHGGLSADAYLSLHGLSFSILWMNMITVSVWLVPLGVATLRTRLFPRWLGWLMLANAASLLVAFFLPYDVWAVLSGLPYLWVLVAAIMMLRRPDRYSTAVEARV